MVIILRGIPCSGKTTWAKEFVKEHYDYIVIGNDTVREIFNIPYYTNEDIHDYSLALLRTALDHHKNVVIDNSNIYDNVLQRYIDVLKEYDASHKLVTLNVTLEEALSRNKTRKDHRTENNIIDTYCELQKTKIKDYVYE